jgi:hypothetical protein
MTWPLRRNPPVPDDPTANGATLGLARQRWLDAIGVAVAALLTEIGAPPRPYVLSIGEPSHGTRGRCYPRALASDGAHAIFVTASERSSLEVAATVAHELVHAAAPEKAGHGSEFALLARSIGLEGPMRATLPGPILTARLNTLIATLGPIPHARVAPPAKQPSRLARVVCPAHERSGAVRMSRAALLAYGPPTCGCGEPMYLDIRSLPEPHRTPELHALARRVYTPPAKKATTRQPDPQRRSS